MNQSDTPQQPALFDTTSPASQDAGPVECLGMTFENDDARREYFLGILREKLLDPEFRKIEGFPIGSDKDILALADPPYYTACPNPFIKDFIRHYGKSYTPQTDDYRREPFTADVGEGKHDPIYNAHSYHTKVPHKAIMRYILHYTEPGDIVFDGFCGTGMTGVAAQMCGDQATVESLGYQVKPDGMILRQETDENGKSVWVAFSKLGSRLAILNDLSPVATFIAYNYNTPVDVVAFEREAKRILKEVEEECGWMYETIHTDGTRRGKINYTVWSDVLLCHECARETVYWDAAVDKERAEVKDVFLCAHCSAEITKRKAKRAYEAYFDPAISKTVRLVKQIPVFINYSVGKKRFEKRPDSQDIDVLSKIKHSALPYQFPINEIPEGVKTREPLVFGVTHNHLFYTKRNLWIISACLSRIERLDTDKRLRNYLKIWFTSSQTRLHRMNRYAAQHKRHVGPLSNTLYISSTPAEISPFYFMARKIKANTLDFGYQEGNAVSCGDAAYLEMSDSSVDYLFVDPPFGHNIMYSDLNILWESWLSVHTNSKPEAIENRFQKKGVDEYRHLMTKCFEEAYRILKPGRWMTVEFSNTKASVWNSIQSALTDAGFIVANVAALNKGRGGLHAIIGPTAVKQDLVISTYKPNGGFEERFPNEATTEEGAWDFVRTHLKYLPVVKKQGRSLVPVPERDPRILFDQMVAYYVRKGYPVPISSQEFQLGLVQRFPERDGMYFLPDQGAEYDKKRMTVKEVLQFQLFVSDEASAIQWLRQHLTKRPQTFQDIHPQFLKEIGGWRKSEVTLELSTLLDQNFLRYDGTGRVPSQIHSYLSSSFKELRNLPKDDPALVAKAKDRWYVPDPNKAGDLEKLREKALLREFQGYTERTKKFRRNERFRMEAVRAGFKRAWQERDYATIIAVARKIPESVLQEDPKLLMWYDQAVTRSGDE